MRLIVSDVSINSVKFKWKQHILMGCWSVTSLPIPFSIIRQWCSNKFEHISSSLCYLVSKTIDFRPLPLLNPKKYKINWKFDV